jgi:hypothetical protein
MPLICAFLPKLFRSAFGCFRNSFFAQPRGAVVISIRALHTHMQSSIKSSKVVKSLLTYLAQALWIIGTDAAKMPTRFIIICFPESNINRVAKVERILAAETWGALSCSLGLAQL